MKDTIQLQKLKFNSLLSFFKELGYNTSSKIGQNEYRVFLNKKSKNEKFDLTLMNKLFEVLDLDEMSTLSIEDFITGFLSFEEEIQKNSELYNFKLAQEQEIYDKILKQCRAYQSEKLNSEGFCENAKICGKISDIDIKRQLEGIKEIILIIIYNEKKEEIHLKMGDKFNKELLKNTFEFKPTSRKDHFEFIMRGVNEKDQVFDIGSKVFPLDDINSQEEYLVQIVIPEMDNSEKIAAYINLVIILYMSDFKYYESLRKKQEKRLKKYMTAAKKASEYLLYVREIYGDLTQMKPELIVDFNNEKLMQRKGVKLNVNFNNVIEAEAPRSNYMVEFNNEREVQAKVEPLKVEFNNSKEVLNPVIENETKKTVYKYNYSSKANLTKVNELEKKIQLLEKEKEIINNKLANLPKPDSNLQQINIKTTTENIKIINNQKNISQQNNDMNSNLSLQNEKTNPKEVYSHEQIIQKKVETTHEVPITFQQTTTTVNTNQNISSPEYNTVIDNNNYNNFDLDAYLKQTTTTTTQTNCQMQENNNQNIITTQANNFGSGGYLHEQTKETTTTTTNASPMYLEGPYIGPVEEHSSIEQTVNINNENYLKNIISGQNATTTTTTTTTHQYETGENLGEIGYGTNETGELKGEIGYGSTINGQVNEYQTAGQYQENTFISNIKTLKPIMNEVVVNNTYNNVIMDKTNNVQVSEQTLPTSYLPDKINKVIYEDKVTTLPVITTNVNSGYTKLDPIVHELKTYYKEETDGGTTITNGYDFTVNTNENNILMNNYSDGNNFANNENMNFVGNYEINGIENGSNNLTEYNQISYNNSNANVYGTTKTTKTVTTTQYKTNYGVPTSENNYFISQ